MSKTKVKKQTDQSEFNELSPDHERRKFIKRRAYLKSHTRGLRDGGMLKDWLQAKKEVENQS